jgi:hypothetical protein
MNTEQLRALVVFAVATNRCDEYFQIFLKLFGRWGEVKALAIAAFFPTIAIFAYAIIYYQFMNPH